MIISTLLSFIFTSALAPANGIEIWYETFGEKENPAYLLIMGGLCQGILWPTEFCQKLAGQGFYVIRYDHRDTGLSTCFDYDKNPYDLLDMAKDGIGLLDHLKIEKAHLCGLSMGGLVAELIAVHDPERIVTLALMSTTCDHRPASFAFDGLGTEFKLSRPKAIYLNWMHRFLQFPPQTPEEQLEERVKCWSILSGSKVPFDEKGQREIHRAFLSRLKHPECMANHLLAIKASFDIIQTAPHQIKAPTLIFHGTEDPIHPPDHGAALAQAIQSSTYILLDGYGHVPNSHFYDLMIQTMKQHAKFAKDTL